MSMSLSGMSLGGHLDTSGSNPTNSSGLSVSSTPTIITKMDIPFHQLMQQQQSHNNAHQLINTGLHSPADLQDHPFASHQQQSSPAPSIDCYSPTLQQHYMPQQPQQQQQHSQHSQQQQQQNDLYSDSFSSYSAALALNNFQHQPTYPTHDTTSQPDQDDDPSPLLTSTQMFQKQIQQEQYQYQQQQQHQHVQQQQQHQHQHPRSFLEESLLATNLTAATSSAHSAKVMAIIITMALTIRTTQRILTWIKIMFCNSSSSSSNNNITRS
ncbi:hypothetical protein BGZ72_002722 [Mortierella alpina]|nr:hypothetical protein BGZ72_002722 [Mortierella alpina]